LEEKMAYMYDEYLVEFVKDSRQICGEVFYPGEKSPVAKVTGHFYCYSDHEEKDPSKFDSLHVDILRVQSEHQKMGIATFLMKKIIEYVEKCKIKHVTTTPTPTGRMSLENLKKFYLRFRFGPAFLSKKIEFVDEENLLNDVMQTEISNGKNAISDIVEEKKDSFLADNLEDEERKQANKEAADKASKVAYLTVAHFLDGQLKSQNSILQIGTSGAGVYGLYLAKKGHNVTVVIPEELEARSMIEKGIGISRLTVVNDSYDYITEIEDDSRDAVLCFGPMHAPLSMESKRAILSESYRICKPGGVLFVSFISNEMMVMDNLFNGDLDFLLGPKFDKVSRKVINSKLRVLTFEEIDTLFKMCDIRYDSCFAAEGISMLMRDKIESMNDKQFNMWLKYHYSICQNPELLGYSTHVVYVVNKK